MYIANIKKGNHGEDHQKMCNLGQAKAVWKVTTKEVQVQSISCWQHDHCLTFIAMRYYALQVYLRTENENYCWLSKPETSTDLERS